MFDPAAWIIAAEDVPSWLRAEAQILDVRSPLARWFWGSLPHSFGVTWQAFSRSTPPAQRGCLLPDDAALGQRLGSAGITARPVVVLSHPRCNWGEEGRIVWMLRSLGHPAAAFVDGGAPAVRAAGLAWSRFRLNQRPPQPPLVIQRTEQWLITQPELRSRLDDPRLILLDTRSEWEFNGATPYGERRGGHLPGAVSLPYHRLLDERGYLRSPSSIRADLQQRGITPDRDIVAYCTGGVRSAFVVCVLYQLGYPHVRNYAGSTWEWAAADPVQYPLRSQP